MDADVAVVGLGGIGSAALWRLSRRRLSVLGIEQYAPGHPYGSSHGLSRVFRLSAREGPQYVPLGQLARRMWSELGEAAGLEILRATGGVMIGPADSVVVSGTLASARAHDLDHEVLTGRALRDRYPQHRILDGDVAVTDPAAGILRPERAITEAVQIACRQGATVLSDVRVIAIEPDSDGVTLQTASGSYRVGEVVLSVGAWTAKLLPELVRGGGLHRVVMTWFRPRSQARQSFDPADFPIFVRHMADGTGAWGLGAFDGSPVKIGTLAYPEGEPDPDALDRAVYAADTADVAEYVARYLPDLDPIPTKVQPCMIATSSDGDFILGPHPVLAHVTVLGGLGGHGFKYAAGIGEVAAGLVVDGRSPVPIDGFSPRRLTLSR